MNIVTSFDPSAAAGGSFNAKFPNSQGKMVVYNESNISIQLQWAGFTTYCPAWTAMLYCVGTPNATINWSQLYVLPVSGGAPISVVVIETYNDNEPILGTYPSALVRSTNVGNALNLATSSTNVANDGNTVQTVVEATLAGSNSSNLFLRNDGTVTIRQFVGAVLTTLFSITPGAGGGASNVLLGDAAHQVEALGTLLCDLGAILKNGQALQWQNAGGIAKNVLVADGSNQVKVSAMDANNIIFQDNAGNPLFTMDGTGASLNAGTFHFLAGHISRLFYTAVPSVTTVAAFVAHGLGVVPDACWIMPNDGSLSTGNFNVYYEKSSMTSTQVKLQSNSASGIPAGLWAVKF